MARLAGFLLGVVLVVAAISLLDRRHFGDGAEVQTNVPVPAADTAPPTEAPSEPAAHVASEQPDTAGSGSAQAELLPEPEGTSAAGIPAVSFFEEDATPVAPAAAAMPPAEPDQALQAKAESAAVPGPQPVPDKLDSQRWQAIWQAFSARRSAQGFAERLETLTGLEYRVDKLAPGQYQVAFSYRDDAERLQALGRIEQSTGLVLARGEADAR